MEERNTPVEVAQSNDLAVEMKRSCENDCSCGNSKEPNEVSMPICFLVKEQAKSLVAIQELQKRMDNIEYSQEDVIDSLVEIRNFLCNDTTKSLSGLNLGSVSNSVIKSPNCSEKSPFTKPRRFSCSPSILQATLEVPRSAIKVKPYPQKVCDQVQNEYKAQSAAANVNEHSQKIFDLAKTKDSALESDKQDSGLDSDCREQNDAHPSLNKHSLNWPKCESNDELLQLLDEISQRSEILQKQLAVVEENVALGDLKSEMSTLYPNHHNAHEHLKSIAGERSKFSFEGTIHKEKRSHQRKLYTHLIMGHDTEVEENVPIIIQSKISGSPEYFERKDVDNNVTTMKKRAASKIDSAMVSSVLKETNVVDLQRQVLIYLVENTVLQTKLSETEQKLTAKITESEKLENSLKDETRLLMMENRELRISLDEQKLEVNSLKSKVSMLERVLQSVTVENRELNWQLGESLGLQNMPRRETHNFSSSFTFGNTTNNSTTGRRSSLPHQFSGQNEMNANCVKSKWISNISSFLDGTIEESDQHLPPSAIGAFKCQTGPLQSSTPLLPFNKQKDIKFNLASSSAVGTTGSQSPSNFQTIKKRLKSNNLEKENAISKSHRSEKCLGENNTFSERYNKGLKLSAENAEGATKFPFNSILEKLKSNSDYKLPKQISVTQDKVPDNSTSEQVKLLSCKTKAASSQSQDNISHSHETNPQINNVNSSQENSQDNLSTRKGRNIHQRIQDILDRIMAESEEAA